MQITLVINNDILIVLHIKHWIYDPRRILSFSKTKLDNIQDRFEDNEF